jgi:putative transposase
VDRQTSRWHLNFIPTHSSWLNQAEPFFAKITEQRIRRDNFPSVKHHRQAILDYIKHHNENPKTFKWIASAKMILSKIEKFCNTFS